MKIRTFVILINCIILAKMNPVSSQIPVNYDEEKVPEYVLPSLLKCQDGTIVDHIVEWEHKRRAEILTLFRDEVYGAVPATESPDMSYVIIEEDEEALEGLARRTQVMLAFGRGEQAVKALLAIYLPAGHRDPPVFVGYNFYGNHTILNDDKLMLTDSWLPNSEELEISGNRATVSSMGKRSHRWPLREILAKGFGLATMYYGDIDPDRPDFSDGIHPLFYPHGDIRPGEHEWGSIAAWSWGMSRILDVLTGIKNLEKSRFIAFGHSRLGKTALWAAVNDLRFDAVISNNSGCGGAALSRRRFGETLAHINTRFPHWFAESFKEYNHMEDKLPVDQHQLIALMAPRPVYIASASEDLWADPRGEYLSGYHASEVFRLYGMTAIEVTDMPSVEKPIHHTVGYHLRAGGHDVTLYDWLQFMRWCRVNIKF